MQCIVLDSHRRAPVRWWNVIGLILERVWVVYPW